MKAGRVKAEYIPLTEKMISDIFKLIKTGSSSSEAFRILRGRCKMPTRSAFFLKLKRDTEVLERYKAACVIRDEYFHDRVLYIQENIKPGGLTKARKELRKIAVAANMIYIRSDIHLEGIDGALLDWSSFRVQKVVNSKRENWRLSSQKLKDFRAAKRASKQAACSKPEEVA
jgi:hypothetical protein